MWKQNSTNHMKNNLGKQIPFTILTTTSFVRTPVSLRAKMTILIHQRGGGPKADVQGMPDHSMTDFDAVPWRICFELWKVGWTWEYDKRIKGKGKSKKKTSILGARLHGLMLLLNGAYNFQSPSHHLDRIWFSMWLVCKSYFLYSCRARLEPVPAKLSSSTAWNWNTHLLTWAKNQSVW